MGTWIMSPYRRLHILLVALLTQIFVKATAAQGIAVASTAAWSSQIVAFWGAILIAVRSSLQGQVTNAVSSIFCSFRVARRAIRITGALSRGNWILFSGWHNGKIRTDVVVICWRSSADLKRLALRVSMQIEAVGFNEWEVWILARKLADSSTAETVAHWIKSPHYEGLCPMKTRQTGENMFPLSDADINQGIAMLKQRPNVDVGDIIQELRQRCDMQATRCAFVSEMNRELENHQFQTSFAYHFTKVDNSETPYQSLERWTGQYGSNRGSTLHCATRMYVMVHVTVATAIGLMGAASGRGLAVWLIAIRPALQALGTKNVGGDDPLLSLVSLDQSVFQYETATGSSLLAGDVNSSGLSWWHLGGTLTIPLIELMLICGGWLYGALQVKKLPPSGVVGHGMLWLSTLVGLSLALKAFISINGRLSGRLVGVWRHPQFNHISIGTRCIEIAVDRILSSPTYSESILGLIAKLLRDSASTDESAAILVAECALRRPATGTLLRQYLVVDILKFQFSGDSVVLRGDPPTAVSVHSVYPWIQTRCCIILTMLCCCVSVVYAYCRLPPWVKIMTELLLSVSAVWFATLERTALLPHNRDTYVCFMVATLVASSVWYVGVRDVA